MTTPTAAPTAVAGTVDLGPVVRELRFSRRYVITFAIVALFFLGLGVFLLINGLFFVNDPSQLVIGGLFAAGAAGLVAYVVYLVGRHATLRRDGIVYRAGREDRAVAYDAILAVQQRITRNYRNGIYTGTTHRYTVQTADGRKIVFSDTLRDVESLGKTLQEEVTRRLLPRALASWQAGQPLNFGIAIISPHGLSVHNETIPWPAIQGMTLRNGLLNFAIAGRNRGWSLPVADLPNMYVFLTLIERITGFAIK